jgi:hypothetical protein
MEGEYTAIIGELISIAVNVILRIIYDSRRAGWGITFIFFNNLTPLFKQSYEYDMTNHKQFLGFLEEIVKIILYMNL